MSFKRIAIVGLGLMGGSLAADCRKQFPRARIIGITRNARALRFARRRGWIHEGFSSLEDGVSQADLVVLCTPVDVLPQTLRRLDHCCKSGAIVTDVGSVKAPLKSAIRKHQWKRLSFVSAHPLVGSHRQGVEAAVPGLYRRGITFLIAPASGRSSGVFRRVRNFWKSLSASVVITTAEEHDRVVAEISHLPHALAVCLVLAVRSGSLSRSGAGFQDTTRIAQGPSDIWTPILMGNRQALLPALRRFSMQLKALERQLQTSDNKGLGRAIRTASRRRAQI